MSKEMTTDSAAPKCVLCGNELEHLVLYGLNATSNYFRCLNKDCLLYMMDLLEPQAKALSAKLGWQKVKEPLSEKAISDECLNYGRTERFDMGFVRGVRWAEAQHGIIKSEDKPK